MKQCTPVWLQCDSTDGSGLRRICLSLSDRATLDINTFDLENSFQIFFPRIDSADTSRGLRDRSCGDNVHSA